MPPKKPKRPKKKPVKKKAKSKPTNVQQQQQTVNVFLAGKRKTKAKKRSAPRQRSATQAMFGGLIGQQNALLNNLDARNDARLTTLEQLMLQKKVEDNSIGTEPGAGVGVGSNVSQMGFLPVPSYDTRYPDTKPTGESGGGLGAEEPPMTPQNIKTGVQRPHTNGGPKKGKLQKYFSLKK